MIRASLLLLVLAGCGGCGGASADQHAVVGTGVADLPAASIQASWPVELATKDKQDALTGASDGWVPLVMKRDYKTATQKLGASGGMTSGRGHAEAAAMYRQAALVAAWSFIETYGNTPQDTDPLGTAHLLAVSYALTGDLDKAREQANKLGDGDPTTPWDKPWKDWLGTAGTPTWPPDLSSLPLDLPAPAVGTWPELPPMPNYSLPERAGATTMVDMADPGGLVALALWHETVAKQASGAEVVDAYLARYRFPIEPAATTVAPLPMEYRFGSDFLVPEDGPFVADLVGAKGIAAVDEWKDRSLLAMAADRSRVNGKVVAENANDVAAHLRSQLLEAANAQTPGVDDIAHRTFADVAQVGALRILALVAEVEGDRDVSGILRISALEQSDGPTRCPNALLSLAAHDAHNRYPARGADILHETVKRYPSLEAARYGLDVLGLRVSREQTRLPPG